MAERAAETATSAATVTSAATAANVQGIGLTDISLQSLSRRVIRLDSLENDGVIGTH
jgi:hypothetical protein